MKRNIKTGQKTKLLWQNPEFRKKMILAHKGKNMKHGFCIDGVSTHFYKKFENMKSRCNCKKHPSYKNYGGRGIKILWKSFKKFRDDMYESYLEHCKEFGKKNTTLDRIDNNGNYCKKNCQWATWKQQNNNQRKRTKKFCKIKNCLNIYHAKGFCHFHYNKVKIKTQILSLSQEEIK